MFPPKIDFYLLAAPDARSRMTAACRLAEKAYAQGLKIAVRTASPGETAEFDDMLWTFGDGSFVPHGVWPMEPAVAAATPVLIGSTSLPATHSDVLINLAPDAPADFSSYARICDLVAGDEQSRRHGRVRWRVYRDAGCSPATVDL